MWEIEFVLVFIIAYWLTMKMQWYLGIKQALVKNENQGLAHNSWLRPPNVYSVSRRRKGQESESTIHQSVTSYCNWADTLNKPTTHCPQTNDSSQVSYVHFIHSLQFTHYFNQLLVVLVMIRGLEVKSLITFFIQTIAIKI